MLWDSEILFLRHIIPSKIIYSPDIWQCMKVNHSLTEAVFSCAGIFHFWVVTSLVDLKNIHDTENPLMTEYLVFTKGLSSITAP